VKAKDPDRDDEIELPPAEAERDRRRDHDLRAAEREGMRTGLAKQFKQVLDLAAKRAREDEEELLLEKRRSHEPKGTHRPHRAAERPPD
jgi:hypothetical protein